MSPSRSMVSTLALAFRQVKRGGRVLAALIGGLAGLARLAHPWMREAAREAARMV